MYNDEFEISDQDLSPGSRAWRRWQWRRAFKWLGVTLGLLVIAVFAFGIFYLHKVTPNIFSFGHLKGEDRGRVNIMMLGVGGPGHDGPELSDTDIIMSVNTRTHQVAIISIPRDLRVRIPGYGYGKINSANSDGGTQLAERVFSNSFGITIDYYVKANFNGLKEVVDAVGGVDIDNPSNLYDPEYPCDNNQYRSCGFRLPAGQYHMNGALALKYVRCRKGTCGDDFGRAARQQQVMQAVKDKATQAGTLANPLALAKLVSAAGNNVTTDLSVNNLMRLNELTKSTPQSDIMRIVFNIKSDGFLVQDNSSSDLLPQGGNFSDIQNFVRNIFTLGPIWSEHPTVVIENGTTTPGLAGKLQQKIQDDGYDVTISAIANAATQDHQTSQIIDYTGGAKPHTLSYLQGLLNLKQANPPSVPTKYPPADLVIIVGNDYAASNSSSGTGSQ